jgi:hypothetical protein
MKNTKPLNEQIPSEVRTQKNNNKLEPIKYLLIFYNIWYELILSTEYNVQLIVEVVFWRVTSWNMNIMQEYLQY